jgi:hypothetical protein
MAGFMTEARCWMREIIAALLVASVCVAAAPTARAADCRYSMRADHGDEIAQGKLSRRPFKDAAGRSEPAFILTLPVPTCLKGTDKLDRVTGARTIHLYSSKQSVNRSIQRFVGKAVQVQGRPFGAATAHHHAPIVMDISDIDAI